MLAVIRCLFDDHDPRLVATAALICFLACFAASALLSRAQVSTGWQRLLWIMVAAVEFGGGVWSLHFVAMLAFMPGMPIGYELAATLRSVVVAIVGSFCAFTLVVRCGGPLRVVGGAAMLTVAIAGMHYTGVAAMRMDGSFDLDHGTVTASVGLCFAFAVAAIVSMGRLATIARQAITTVLLSLAICGLHFVGMSALVLRVGDAHAMPPGLLGSGALAVAVATASISLVLVSLVLSIADRLLHDRACAEKTRLRKLTAVSFEGLLIEQDGIIVDANDRICEFSGHTLAEIIGKPVGMILTPAEAVDGGPPSSGFGGSDHMLRRIGGDAMPVELLSETVLFGRGEAKAVAVRDLTARHENEAALQRLAHHDPLTGLANRMLLDARLRQAFEDVRAPVRRGAVLCLDLDRFKPVNDLLGHAAGDKLLIAVALRLSALLRQSDTLARMGGDEFVILMPDVADIVACRSLANRIVQSMQDPFELDGQQVVIGVSIGIALYPQDGHTADELLRYADIAMYRSKEEGRGTYRLFEAKMDAELQNRRAIERDLRCAIESRSLELFYQPLFGCEAGRIEGYEALLRWRHPERGFVPPAEFIPIAEESGLILPLGQWVLETACAAAAGWAIAHRIAVNLSPAQFKQTDLVDRIMDAVRRAGLPPDRLELEITEGVLINDPERAVTLLSRLRSLGIRVSLDDFGTGYSSLSYLRQFPLDKIKIDRSFISDLGVDERSASIVRAVVALAHGLGLSVTAEGVETAEQLDLLRQQLCNQVQGYFLGRPAPLPDPDRPGPEGGPAVEPGRDREEVRGKAHPVMDCVLPCILLPATG